MAEEIISLGCNSDDEIAYDEEILQLLREEWDFLPDSCDSAFDDEIYALLNANIDGLDDPHLFHACEEESLIDSEDEEWMLAEEQQHGGNPLFSVTRQRLGSTRQWQNGTILQERMRL